MDIKELKRVAENHIQAILQHYIPDGTWDRKEYVFRNPARIDNSKGSCKFNVSKMRWKDFATAEGGDVFDLVQLVLNCDVKRAKEEIESFCSVAKPEKSQKEEPKVQILSELPSAPATDFTHYKYGAPIQTWEHKTQDNKLIGYICRYILPDGAKQDLPYYWGVIKKTMEKRFIFSAPKTPRPLFGLETLNRKTKSKSIIIVEGQKCQHALANIVPIPVVTWTQGSNGIKYCDWGVIKNSGKNIIYWPDNDEAGFKNISVISELLEKDIEFLQIPQDKSKGWDCADFIEDGATIKDVMDFIVTNKYTHTFEEQPETIEEIVDIVPTENDEVPTKINSEPFQCLGYDDGRYYYFPSKLQQVRSYTASEHSQSNLLELAPLSHWESLHPKPNGGVNWAECLNELLRIQESIGIYKADYIRGRGIWRDGNKTVVHAGNHLIVGNKTIEIQDFKSEYTYVRSRSLNMHFEKTASLEETKCLYDMVHGLSWEKQNSALFLLGWLVIAPICGSLKWRPHIWLTAGAGMGKSWVLSNIIRPLIGEHIAALGNSSQAGLRQKAKNDAIPIVIDEFESNDKKGHDIISSVLELARQSSSEGESTTYKGTISHRSVSFNANSIFCFASIGLNIKEFADETRITVLKLTKNKNKEQFKKIENEVYKLINDDFRNSLIAKTIENLPTLLKNMEKINAYLTDKIGKRLADQYSTLYAGAWSLKSENIISEDEIIKFVGEITLDDINDGAIENDEKKCLDLILESKIKILQKEYSVAELINEVYKYCDEKKNALFGTEDPVNSFIAHEAYDTLSRAGIKVDCRAGWKSSGEYNKNIIIADNFKEIDKILEGTAYKGKHKHYLLRLQNTKKSSPCNFAGNSKRGVIIPHNIVKEDD